MLNYLQHVDHFWYSFKICFLLKQYFSKLHYFSVIVRNCSNFTKTMISSLDIEEKILPLMTFQESRTVGLQQPGSVQVEAMATMVC